MPDVYADLLPFKNDLLAFLLERGNEAKDALVPLALGPDPTYLLTDPDYAKSLLMMPEDVVDKGPLFEPVRNVFGDVMLAITGREARRRRAVLNTLVTRSAVADLVPLIAAEMRTAVSQALQCGTFEAREFGANLAMRLICLVAFGPDAMTLDEQRKLKYAAGELLNGLLDVSLCTTEADRAAADKRLAGAKQDIDVIFRAIRGRAPDSAASRAFSTLQLSEQDLFDELVALLFAGNDSTGSAFGFLLQALSTMPELAAAIALESSHVRDESGEFDPEKLPSATTSIATVRELLRMYPSTAWFPRGVRKNIEFAGRHLTPGSMIIVSQWLFHRSPRFWDAPDEFRLDRDYHTPAYLPFGTGPRICVGWSLAQMELQMLAFETAAALRLTPISPIGPPEPFMVQLWPSRFTLKAMPRVAADESERGVNADRARPQPAVRAGLADTPAYKPMPTATRSRG